MKDRWETYFMDVAERTALLSYAKRLQVGAVAVRDRRIVACGFNGTPAGLPNECEDIVCKNGKDTCACFDNACLVTKPNVLHAEENLILFCAHHGISLKGCQLFCTHHPCLNCARMIYGAGISKVIYKYDYTGKNSDESKKFLSSVGFAVEKFSGEVNEYQETCKRNCNGYGPRSIIRCSRSEAS